MTHRDRVGGSSGRRKGAGDAVHLVRHLDAPLPSTDMIPGSRSASCREPWPQVIDQAQYFSELVPRHGNLGQMETDIATMARTILAPTFTRFTGGGPWTSAPENCPPVNITDLVAVFKKQILSVFWF